MCLQFTGCCLTTSLQLERTVRSICKLQAACCKLQKSRVARRRWSGWSVPVTPVMLDVACCVLRVTCCVPVGLWGCCAPVPSLLSPVSSLQSNPAVGWLVACLLLSFLPSCLLPPSSFADHSLQISYFNGGARIASRLTFSQPRKVLFHVLCCTITQLHNYTQG